jgi:hypothetical protein
MNAILAPLSTYYLSVQGDKMDGGLKQAGEG